jgi:hypothetical protein
MGNIIKLTESDLMNIVKKVISEQHKQTAAFTAGQNLGQGIKNTGNQAVSTVQKAGQAVGQGVKNVTLTITDANSCTDTFTASITVKDNPQRCAHTS